MNKLSRRKLATYVANQAKDYIVPAALLKELAGYLVASRRVREADLVVRAIEDELATRGLVVADVASAHALSADEKAQIAQRIGAEHVVLRETVDPTLIGGVRIKTPGHEMDATIANKLQALKRAKL